MHSPILCCSQGEKVGTPQRQSQQHCQSERERFLSLFTLLPVKKLGCVIFVGYGWAKYKPHLKSVKNVLHIKAREGKPLYIKALLK